MFIICMKITINSKKVNLKNADYINIILIS